MNFARYDGGRNVVGRAALVAVVGLALTLVGGLFDAQRALWAYHVAFVYWAGIALGALLVNMAFQAGNAKWYVVIRRVLEAIPLSGGLFVVLFIPIVLGASRLFPWMSPGSLDGEMRQLAVHRRPYLNLPFFAVRAAVYFGLWIVVANLL